LPEREGRARGGENGEKEFRKNSQRTKNEHTFRFDGKGFLSKKDGVRKVAIKKKRRAR